MNKTEDILQLTNLYSEIKEKKFPDFPNNETLSNWIVDLILLDSYYAGYASSVIGGSKISQKDLFDLKEYYKRLETLSVQSNEDKKILEECKEYLTTLKEIDFILRRLSTS